MAEAIAEAATTFYQSVPDALRGFLQTKGTVWLGSSVPHGFLVGVWSGADDAVCVPVGWLSTGGYRRLDARCLAWFPHLASRIDPVIALRQERFGCAAGVARRLRSVPGALRAPGPDAARPRWARRGCR
jgi:hypothetical protein